jgi:DNA primase
MDILSLLQQILGTYTRQRDECLFHCPFCHHSKKKLSINIITNKWKCWVCGAKGGHILWLLKKLNVSREQLNQARELFDDIQISKFKETTSETQLLLPKEYKPLWVKQNSYPYLHALTYIKNRGIRTEDVLRYRIGYCEEGNYTGRVIIPSYDKDNKLNYFIARSFYEGGMKYKNPPVSKNVIVFENLISWNEPVILVEGIFDAITVRRNAIPLLGKTIPKQLEHALLENGVKEVIVFLDEDARNEAINLEQRLKQYQINTKIVLTSGKDASDMGFDSSWNMIGEAKTTNFKDYIETRLSIT